MSRRRPTPSRLAFAPTAGQTALYQAVVGGHAEITRSLVAAGADANVQVSGSIYMGGAYCGCTVQWEAPDGHAVARGHSIISF